MARILWIVLVVLVALWLIGFIADIAGGFIHILLVIALIILVYNLVTGRREQPAVRAEGDRVQVRWPVADAAVVPDERVDRLPRRGVADVDQAGLLGPLGHQEAAVR